MSEAIGGDEECLRCEKLFTPTAGFKAPSARRECACVRTPVAGQSVDSWVLSSTTAVVGILTTIIDVDLCSSPLDLLPESSRAKDPNPRDPSI